MKLLFLLSLVFLSLADPDLSLINDPKAWKLINAECTASNEEDKHIVRLKPKVEVAKGSSIGLALIEGQDFTEGTIELDLKGKGKDEASFVGIAFSVADERTFESIYFRPFNFMRDDATARTHAVQYVAWPAHPWEKLRKDTPGKFESAISPVPDPAAWFHARIEVTKSNVSVWVDGAKDPCLTVDRFEDHKKGKVGLFVDSKEGWFRNLKVHPAK